MVNQKKAKLSLPIDRRGFLKISAIAGGLLVAGHTLRSALMPETVTIRQTRWLMGTLVNITLVAEEEASGRAALMAVFAEMERLIHIFDHRLPDSPVAVLNQEGRLDAVPQELFTILQKSREVAQRSKGAFDISIKPVIDAYRHRGMVTQAEMRLVDYHQLLVCENQVSVGLPGMQITLDGIAKGRVVDGAVACLQTLGYKGILVEAGGDLSTRGARADGHLWNIGIAHPRPTEQGQLLALVGINDQAVATSGDYLNKFSKDYHRHHIVDPRTGSSPGELCSATVIAPTAMEADALSTTLMILGVQAGLSLVEKLPRVEALMVTKKMERVRSSGFPSD